MSLNENPKQESPPTMEPEADQMKELKEEPTLASPPVDDSDMDFMTCYHMQSEMLPLWPIFLQEEADEILDDFQPTDPSMSLTEKRKRASPPLMDPEAVGDSQTDQLKKVKEGPTPASPILDDSDKDFLKCSYMHYERPPLWPISLQVEVDDILEEFRMMPLNPKGTGDPRYKAKQIVDRALKKAEKEEDESGLSPSEARDVFDKELREQLSGFYGDYRDWYNGTKKAISSVQTFYQSRKHEFYSTFIEYFQSEEAIQTLLSDKDILYNLMDQHPELMRMLQEKLEQQ